MAAFRFKQFSVEQDDVAMKVGTDGVLIGAWVNCADAVRVLDIGTGTGLIALMVAQRSDAQSIVGIDIDSAAAVCAARNFAASPWSERLSAHQKAAQEYDGEKFDLILSNPPYFVDSLLCPDDRRTTARHTTELTFEQLDSAVCRLLSESGRFALILPTEQMEKYMALTALKVVRRCDVVSVVGGVVKRVMAEFAFDFEGVPATETITIEKGRRGDYCEQYIELTKEFYLKF
ncbi:MAG: methyltransferase [Alistipes sp.]|nr:methyltransferase [Alistipes sp.]